MNAVDTHNTNNLGYINLANSTKSAVSEFSDFGSVATSAPASPRANRAGEVRYPFPHFPGRGWSNGLEMGDGIDRSGPDPMDIRSDFS